jgi:hypothetical protein
MKIVLCIDPILVRLDFRLSLLLVSTYSRSIMCLEEKAEGVSSVLHFEQSEQKGEDDNKNTEPDVDSKSLFRR